MKLSPPIISLLLLTYLSGISEAQIRAIRIQSATAVPQQLVPSIGATNQIQIIEASELAQSEVVAAAEGGELNAAATQRKQEMEQRLEGLNGLQFNRLPSQILETWSRPAAEPTDDRNADLPPAPDEAFLYSDVRFAIATEKLREDFTLGHWNEVAAFLKLLPEAKQKSLYLNLLTAATGANDGALQGAENGRGGFDQRQLQSQFLAFDDLFKLAELAPTEIKDEHVALFGAAFAKSISLGNNTNDLVDRMQAELKKENPAFDQRQMAKILLQSNLPIEAGKFLPELDKAKLENDHEALNLLSQHYLAINQRDNKTADLEQAWQVTQAILAAEDVDQEQRKQALARAVVLSTRVNDDLGQKWLHDSFVAQPVIGMEVLGAIGADSAKSLKDLGGDTTSRLARLKLQNDAVNALLKISSDQANQWQPQLNLLAQTWLREAQISYADDTSTSVRPSMRRDMFGNIFYGDNGGYNYQRERGGYLQPIATKDLLNVIPCAAWLKLVDEALQPQFDMLQAQLYLKVSEQDLALPFIEKLGAKYPKKAKDLIDEFITVWTRNHNPNADQGRTNYYMYMYGYESRAESIPLTRSKQQRNLKELAEMVQRLQKLSDDDLDEDLLAEAFMTCHSDAEVYQIRAIEEVFGPLEEMKSEAVAAITNKMRMNLATLWRDANVQKDKKTKRKKPEIEAEVIAGYETAVKIIDDAQQKDANNWKLMATQAALLHDENNYRADLENSSEFSPRRQKAMELFQAAATEYVAGISDLEEHEYTTEPFEQWFYASLGASDLAMVTEKHITDPKQPALIRELLESMPESARKWHIDRFANLLFNRMSSVKPQLKFKYLDKGFEIAGDNEQAAEAKQVHDYYKDLVTEIRLETQIDGSDRVGNGKPFGVLVTLKHTQEIERESGGFGRYLQNQNSSNYFSYNYGRPTEDYRDKFDESVRQLYAEQFEVLSVTFEKPDIESIPSAEIGWRVTPYAYLLLKAKGPEVDKLPPVKLDLDFLDTSGYAILPVESATIPIDASGDQQETRPFENLEITQILDERQATDGKLILEIKAQAQGLVPDLDQILKVEPTEFEVTSIDDAGISIAQFDPEENQPIVLSERNWVVSLAAKENLPGKPQQFEFPQPSIELNEVVYQRYVDADLANVEPTISLEEDYGEVNYSRMAWLIAGAVVAASILFGLLIAMLRRMSKKVKPVKKKFDGDVTPFAAISLLQDIYSNNGLSDSKKVELKASIDRLEKHYFGHDSASQDAPNLGDEVKRWSK